MLRYSAHYTSYPSGFSLQHGFPFCYVTLYELVLATVSVPEDQYDHNRPNIEALEALIGKRLSSHHQHDHKQPFIMKASAILFRIFYSSSYTGLFFLLLALIVLTPADVIYQAYKAGRIFDIFIVAGAYILTALFCALLYASRLYTNRSVLKDIPKTFMPIEKEDLPGKRVRRLIVDSLARSVVIAYQARPRPRGPEPDSPSISARISVLMRADDEAEHDVEPTWGTVAHPGWSPPFSPDLPDLQYETVIRELTDLIEAKAVSLAPVNPRLTTSVDETPMPDEDVIEILQRPVEMGMRQYLGQLKSLGVVQDTTLSRDFLALYEQARFGPQPLTEQEFRALMSMFAEVLRTMTSLETPYDGPSTSQSAQTPLWRVAT